MVVGVIVADNQAIAQKAARIVDVKYEELPVVVTIEVRYMKLVENGNILWHVKGGNANCDHLNWWNVKRTTITSTETFMKFKGKLISPKWDLQSMIFFLL